MIGMPSPLSGRKVLSNLDNKLQRVPILQNQSFCCNCSWTERSSMLPQRPKTSPSRSPVGSTRSSPGTPSLLPLKKRQSLAFRSVCARVVVPHRYFAQRKHLWHQMIVHVSYFFVRELTGMCFALRCAKISF